MGWGWSTYHPLVIGSAPCCAACQKTVAHFLARAAAEGLGRKGGGVSLLDGNFTPFTRNSRRSSTFYLDALNSENYSTIRFGAFA